MKAAGVFIVLVIAAGMGAAVGSVVGSLIAHPVLFVGGAVGGLCGSWLGAWLSAWMNWIPERGTLSVALGATVGFACAILIAVNTLHTPVGPMLSTLLVGVGGLVGRRLSRAPEG
jgi:NCAIR mutase (PurE)-related protein